MITGDFNRRVDVCPHIVTCRQMFRLDAVTLTACADPVPETKPGFLTSQR